MATSAPYDPQSRYNFPTMPTVPGTTGGPKKPTTPDGVGTGLWNPDGQDVYQPAQEGGTSPVDEWTTAYTQTPMTTQGGANPNDPGSAWYPQTTIPTPAVPMTAQPASTPITAPTTAPAAPQRDYRNPNDLRSQLNEWAGAVPYSDPSVTDGSYDWLGAINDKGGLNDGNMDYWRSRVQSDPNDYSGANPDNWYRNEDRSRAAGNAPQTDPRSLGLKASATTAAPDATWGPAPGPDWVPIAGGGWVPPTHPLAAEAVGPPGQAPGATTQPIDPGIIDPAPVDGPPRDSNIDGDTRDPYAGTPLEGTGGIKPPQDEENSGVNNDDVVLGDPNAPPPAEAGNTPATVDSAQQQLLDMLVSQMSQSGDVDPNDPNIRNRTDMFQSRQDRARQGFLREQAEASGPYGNLNSERRASSEEVGQNTSAFEQNLITQELTSRRAEIQTAMTQLQGYLTEQQRQAMTKELADLDRALAMSQMAQQNSQFGQSLAQNQGQFTAGQAQQQGQFDANYEQNQGQFDASQGQSQGQFDANLGQQLGMFNTSQGNQSSQFNSQLNQAMQQFLASLGQQAYEFDTHETNQVLG